MEQFKSINSGKIIGLGILKIDDYEIKENIHDYGIFSLKDYDEDEIVYKGNYILLPNDGTSFNYCTDKGINVYEKSEIHYILTNDNKRIRYSDCIINHSCEGNIYLWKKTQLENYDENKENEFIMKSK